MVRTILIYGVLLAAGAFGLQWLEFQFVVRTHATETYLVLIALAFLGLGIWVGARLFRRPPPTPFDTQPEVRETLGISDREFEVLDAAGRGPVEQGNRQAARTSRPTPSRPTWRNCSKNSRRSGAPRPFRGRASSE